MPQNFLKDIENYHIQVLHDGVSSSLFEFLHVILLPRIILMRNDPRIPKHSENEKLSLDIFNSRPGQDTVSIWMSKSFIRTRKVSKPSKPYLVGWLTTRTEGRMVFDVGYAIVMDQPGSSYNQRKIHIRSLSQISSLWRSYEYCGWRMLNLKISWLLYLFHIDFRKFV